MLKAKDWYARPMHGNKFQSGVPDIWAVHNTYGYRWIEVKMPHKYSFTPAQLKEFRKISAFGGRIWILTAATESEYEKLFQKPNWETFVLRLL